MNNDLLTVDGLKMYYHTSDGFVKAIDGVSFNVKQGEIYGLVGESGCGKSSLALTIMRSLPPNGKIIAGKILLDGEDILNMPEREFKKDIIWKKIAVIPQGALNSLDPLYKVSAQINETLKAHGYRGDPKSLIDELLKVVDLSPSVLNMYPHQLSGGMKQRILILMSLLFKPLLIIADEPTTALDVLTQEHILKTIRKTVKDFKVSLILISHDLPVVIENSNKIAIMYAGKIVEYGDSNGMLEHPMHPYTMGLLNSHPDIESGQKYYVYIPVTPPSLRENINGCSFSPRCPLATEECTNAIPKLREIESNHYVACHHYDKVKLDIWQMK